MGNDGGPEGSGSAKPRACRRCGKVLPPLSSVCLDCGTVNPREGETDRDIPRDGARPRGNLVRNLFLACLSLASIAILVLVVLFFLFQGKGEQQQEPVAQDAGFLVEGFMLPESARELRDGEGVLEAYYVKGIKGSNVEIDNHLVLRLTGFETEQLEYWESEYLDVPRHNMVVLYIDVVNDGDLDRDILSGASFEIEASDMNAYPLSEFVPAGGEVCEDYELQQGEQMSAALRFLVPAGYGPRRLIYRRGIGEPDLEFRAYISL